MRLRAIYTAVLGLVAVNMFAISRLPLPAEFFGDQDLLGFIFSHAKEQK